MITLSVTWFILVFLSGVIAIVIAATHEGIKNALFWWYTAYWLTCLALLSPSVFVR